MARSFVGIALLLLLPSLALAQQPAEATKTSEASDPPAQRRLSPEQRQQLRERLEKKQPELSSLKRMTWKVADDTREALVYLPPQLDPKKSKPPVIFAFHGHGGRAEFAARKIPLHEFWPEAICVYPQGLPTPVPVIDVEGKRSGWQKYIGDQKDRDLAFFDAMLQSLKTDYHVDESRIYSTGHSNGGYFTYVLWAARGDILAAVAPIAATVSVRDFAQQKPKPVFHVAGEQDPIVRFAMQQRTMEQIRKLNACDAEGKVVDKLGIEYASKAGNVVITYIHPGGHEIPSEAPKLIAQFFQKHPKK